MNRPPKFQSQHDKDRLKIDQFRDSDPEEQLRFWKEYDNEIWESVIADHLDAHFHTGDPISADKAAAEMYEKGLDEDITYYWEE